MWDGEKGRMGGGTGHAPRVHQEQQISPCEAGSKARRRWERDWQSPPWGAGSRAGKGGLYYHEVLVPDRPGEAPMGILSDLRRPSILTREWEIPAAPAALGCQITTTVDPLVAQPVASAFLEDDLHRPCGVVRIHLVLLVDHPIFASDDVESLACGRDHDHLLWLKISW